MIDRRACLCGLASFIALPRGAFASEEAAWRILADGGIAVFRHALAPGTGDPPGFRLDDCATQRNLSADGRRQAARIGEAFRSRGIVIGRVLSSQWCRARETARIAFGRAEDEPAISSFFADRSRSAAQTELARSLVAGWNGSGALILVTHQVNVTALSGIFPQSGEAVVIRRGGSGPGDVAGRIAFA
jgi:phosphohistidine phosphatase SixA